MADEAVGQVMISVLSLFLKKLSVNTFNYVRSH